jgi:hypothetical protein
MGGSARTLAPHSATPDHTRPDSAP